ncbi:MAG: hypothetical protein ACKOJB_07425, partial [Chthoniobacterales bacterium]
GRSLDGIRQLGHHTAIHRSKFMKAKHRSKNAANPLSRATRAALQKAGKQARRTAKAFGTPVYVMRDGKIVAEKS